MKTSPSNSRYFQGVFKMQNSDNLMMIECCREAVCPQGELRKEKGLVIRALGLRLFHPHNSLSLETPSRLPSPSSIPARLVLLFWWAHKLKSSNLDFVNFLLETLKFQHKICQSFVKFL